MQRINVRAKGHRYEYEIIKLFKELGYTECVSSRSESKRLDDAKVDLCYTHPWYVQCKAVEKLSNLHTILDSMPKKKGLHNLVFHKRSRQGSIVAMKTEAFVHIVKLLIEHGAIIIPEC